jgi:hypothetical protein
MLFDAWSLVCGSSFGGAIPKPGTNIIAMTRIAAIDAAEIVTTLLLEYIKPAYRDQYYYGQ